MTERHVIPRFHRWYEEFTSMEHIPVLLHEVIDHLAIDPSGTYIDGTMGACGHARAIVERLGVGGHYIGFDLDPSAIAHAQEVLRDSTCRVDIVHKTFTSCGEWCHDNNVEAVDGIILDLGWNSDQFADRSRGFSFLGNGELDMRLDGGSGASGDSIRASDIVMNWSEELLADLFFAYSDERYSRRIAEHIVKERKRNPIVTTQDLVRIVESAVPASYRMARIHPATKVFQALRIAVNNELGALREALPIMMNMLRPGGRLCIITFHSTEDRLVKQAFRDAEKAGLIRSLDKKGIASSREEISRNPRARSARLRSVERI